MRFMMKMLPSLSFLNEAIEYDRYTGMLFWKERPESHFLSKKDWDRFHSTRAGKRAFATMMGNGYLSGAISCRRYSTHRIAYFMATGEQPVEVDHIDGNRANNKLENLRSASIILNRRNASKPSNNSSGIVGVSWRSDKAKWRAHITINDKSAHLGYFLSREEAVKARIDAELKIGFSANGRRGR